jgi:hypothetical protein
MMILVRYLDGSYDMVMTHHLENLISSNRIIGFERSNKWVTIGIEPLRGYGGDYVGEERRVTDDEA